MGAYVCPRCGRRFSKRPMEHACVRLSVASHFARSEPNVKALFARLVKVAKSGGRVQVSALKTMVALNAPKLAGGAAGQKKALKVSLILPGVRTHATLRKRYPMSEFRISHQFVLKELEEFDEAFEELVREAVVAAGE